MVGPGGCVDHSHRDFSSYSLIGMRAAVASSHFYKIANGMEFSASERSDAEEFMGMMHEAESWIKYLRSGHFSYQDNHDTGAMLYGLFLEDKDSPLNAFSESDPLLQPVPNFPSSDDESAATEHLILTRLEEMSCALSNHDTQCAQKARDFCAQVSERCLAKTANPGCGYSRGLQRREGLADAFRN